MQSQQPLTLDEAFQLAMQHFKQSRQQRAEGICHEILSVAPLQSDALTLLRRMDTWRLEHYRKLLHEEEERAGACRELLPNFVMIGAMRCGTTSLYHYLKEHPDIYLPEKKEHGVYLEMNALTEKIKDQFDMLVRTRKEWADILASQYQGQKMIGDASTYYTKFPFQGQGVPEIIHVLKPQARIIYLLRNPIERIVSHYLHWLDHSGQDNGLSFDGFLRESLSPPLHTSLYHFQLGRFLGLFGLQQIKVITLEELKTDPVGTTRDVFRFLGVEPEFLCSNLQHAHNVSRSRSQMDSDHLRFPRDVFEKIMPFIREDVKRLEGLLGRTFDDWDFSPKTWTTG